MTQKIKDTKDVGHKGRRTQRMHDTKDVGHKQGWALCSFPFGTLRSFPFLKKNVPFFSVLFSSFGRLMRPKRMEKNAKNATFFCKELKRTQECFVLLQKNGRTFRSFFNIYLEIYIDIHIYRYI